MKLGSEDAVQCTNTISLDNMARILAIVKNISYRTTKRDTNEELAISTFLGKEKSNLLKCDKRSEERECEMNASPIYERNK